MQILQDQDFIAQPDGDTDIGLRYWIGSDKPSWGAVPLRLTNAGQEFLDGLRSKEAMALTKSSAKAWALLMQGAFSMPCWNRLQREWPRRFWVKSRVCVSVYRAMRPVLAHSDVVPKRQRCFRNIALRCGRQNLADRIGKSKCYRQAVAINACVEVKLG